MSASVQGRVDQWASRPVGPNEVLLHLINVPKAFSKRDMLQLIDQRGFAGWYNFFYLPRSFETLENLGYAFINFVSKEAAESFVTAMGGFKTSPGKPLIVKTSSHQGMQERLKSWARGRCRRVWNPELVPYIARPGELRKARSGQAQASAKGEPVLPNTATWRNISQNATSATLAAGVVYDNWSATSGTFVPLRAHMPSVPHRAGGAVTSDPSAVVVWRGLF